jgi:diguanylate cyclase (GGDEF)-like protein
MKPLAWVAAPLTRWWRSEFEVYSALDRDSAEVRARHMQTLQGLTPLMVLANLVNGALVAGTFRGTVAGHWLMGWLALLAAGCSVAGLSWWRHRHPRPLASPRAVMAMVRGAAVLALLWGSAVLAWFPAGNPEQRMLLGIVTVGMLCGGAFAMATVPQAALVYLGILAIAAAGALLSSTGAFDAALIVLLAIYVGVLGWSVLNTARVFTARLVSEREAARQGQLVSLLLRDFEEHAADLLWEVDASGRFGHVAPRLAQALGHTEPRIMDFTLQQTLARHSAPAARDAPGGAAALVALHAALASGRAFRDIAVPMATIDGLRWWSVTAKPLVNERGRDAGWRGVIADVTAAREAHQRLAFMAHFDSLTGLANRVQLREQLSLALAGATAVPPQRCALVWLDVDHFKTINDTLGHAAGDAVLVATAQRLRACLRPSDLPARLGGDEFALLLRDPPADAYLPALAQRLVDTLCQPIEVDGRPVPVGVSLGLAVAPDHGSTLDELMAHADLALYAAKEAGRSRHACYVPRLGDRHRRQLQLESGLREALALGQLHLHWQPRIAIGSWQVLGAEALLRWDHPELGPVSPVEFIPVAEQSGLIADIGAWVLARACHEAKALPATMQVSVNVSPAQLRREDFAHTVRSALAAAELPADRLEIEITESLFIDATALALRHLHTLRAAGTRVALDDFGTGYSSLAYLRRFPFDTLKIDRSFVRELLQRHDARAIVTTIIELARTLGMQTLAEGVEEPAQLAALREAGCDAIQGFLVARPMPLAALCQLLGNWTVPTPESVARPSGPPDAAPLRDVA